MAISHARRMLTIRPTHEWQHSSAVTLWCVHTSCNSLYAYVRSFRCPFKPRGAKFETKNYVAIDNERKHHKSGHRRCLSLFRSYTLNPYQNIPRGDCSASPYVTDCMIHKESESPAIKQMHCESLRACHLDTTVFTQHGFSNAAITQHGFRRSTQLRRAEVLACHGTTS